MSLKFPADMDPWFEKTLRELLSAGFELPLHTVYIARNGSMVYDRYEKVSTSNRVETHFIAKHMEKDGLPLPWNVMFVDRNGMAAHIVMGASSEDESPKIVH